MLKMPLVDLLLKLSLKHTVECTGSQPLVHPPHWSEAPSTVVEYPPTVFLLPLQSMLGAQVFSPQ